MNKPVGRPVDYDPKFCKVAYDFLKKGKSRVQLAAHLDISKSMLYRYENDFAEFRDAIALGITHAEAKWMDKAEDNMENKNFSVRMYELQMMNRFKWKKNIENESNFNMADVTEEVKARFKENLAKYEKNS